MATPTQQAHAVLAPHAAFLLPFARGHGEADLLNDSRSLSVRGRLRGAITRSDTITGRTGGYGCRP